MEKRWRLHRIRWLIIIDFCCLGGIWLWRAAYCCCYGRAFASSLLFVVLMWCLFMSVTEIAKQIGIIVLLLCSLMTSPSNPSAYPTHCPTTKCHFKSWESLRHVIKRMTSWLTQVFCLLASCTSYALLSSADTPLTKRHISIGQHDSEEETSSSNRWDRACTCAHWKCYSATWKDEVKRQDYLRKLLGFGERSIDSSKQSDFFI